MTAAWLVLAAGIAAVVDWVAVARELTRVEYVAKPLTPALLVAAAAVAGLGDLRPWVVAALVLGLVGDIALLGSGELAFLVGLTAFLLGHVAYLVAFALTGLSAVPALAGALVAVVAGGLVLPAVLRGARRAGGIGLVVAVTGYALVLAALTSLAAGTAVALVAAGGVVFLASDATLARGRFVGPVRHGPLAVAVTYHAAQFLLVIGLIRAH